MAVKATKMRAPAPGKESKKAAPAEQAPAPELVSVRLSTRLARRIRAGITVGREAQKLQVSAAQLAALEADAHITVVRL